MIMQNEKDVRLDVSHIRHFKNIYNSSFEYLRQQFYHILKKNIV
jgi:hypothetical protein